MSSLYESDFQTEFPEGQGTRLPPPAFAVSEFGGFYMVQMNFVMAHQLQKFIEEVEDQDPQVYALAKRLKAERLRVVEDRAQRRARRGG